MDINLNQLTTNKRQMDTEQISKLLETGIDFIVQYGLKIVGGIAFLIIGLWIAKVITKNTKRLMEKKSVDQALISFSTSLIGIGLKVLIIISAMGVIGIQMTSFIAILGAAGLAVGLALQGTLQNFAGGALILMLKPYKIGDYVSVQGHDGVIADIHIFNTIMTTVDNKTIIIPNGSISTSSLINFSTQTTRRIQWIFGVAYGSDFKMIKDTIQGVLDADPRILKDPETFIGLGEMADSSINFTTRAWVKSADYWGVFFDVNKEIYQAFNAKGIAIPFPQMDVHMDK